nr:mercury methylation corrinoid protein HgcA [Acidaminobacter sp. JC074]
MLKHEDISNDKVIHALDGNRLKRQLTLKDHLGSLGARIGFRDDYMIKPGLYQIGHPDPSSDVLVTCNYKLTIDLLRKHLKKDYHILVLDTDGINVWCAAGKGKFGTAELIYALNNYGLEKVVNHKKLILPQLGAPGMQKHLIQKVTGYQILYGPVRISDMDFYTETYQKTEKMKRIDFDIKDRLVLTPLEFIKGLKVIILVILLSLTPIINLEHILMTLVSLTLGTIVFPALLPIRPMKMFYLNGILLSLVCNFVFLYQNMSVFNLGWYLLMALYTSYLCMNFTGSTTFTSLSGVEKEMDSGLKF